MCAEGNDTAMGDAAVPVIFLSRILLFGVAGRTEIAGLGETVAPPGHSLSVPPLGVVWLLAAVVVIAAA